MPTLAQRLSFLRRVERGYVWLLLSKKLGRKRAHRRHGKRSFVVPLDSPGGIQLMRQGEEWVVPLLGALLPRMPGTFVDVGANVGHSLLQLRAVDDERPWVGFEPAPQSCATLRSVIEANGFTRTTLIEGALSDQTGESALYGVSGTDGSATLLEGYHGPNHPRQFAIANVKLVDAAVLNGAPAGIVKIDVEGMELDVIRALRQVISRDRPVMLCEILPVNDDGTARATKLRERQDALQNELRDLQYRIVHVDTNGIFSDVAAPLNGVNPHAGNYVLLPAERFTELRPLL